MIGSNIVVLLGIVGNIGSVVGIVILNKYITEIDGFNYMVFLSFLHFLFTAVGLRIMLCFNVFTQPTTPLSNVLPVAMGSLMSVAFMNLNLSYNSVGFYQVRDELICFILLVVKTCLHSIYTTCSIFGI